MDKTSLAQYKLRMLECVGNDYPEDAHIQADDILCEVLIELGQQELVDLYNKVEKWYA